jgi:polyisoprenoid-binding protein YceI
VRVFIRLLLMIFSFLSFAAQSASDDTRICAPFRGGIVDPAIIQSMLQASEKGYLYRIHAENSKVGFCVNSAIGRVEAFFKGIQGGMALRKEVWGDRSQMLVMVDTNTLALERDYLKDMLKSEYFLDTYTYSKILFVSTKFWWPAPNRAVLEGMLTMHGVKKQIYFDIKITSTASSNPQSVGDIIVTAKSFIKRSDFEMNNLTFLVNDTIELCMRIEASLFKKHRNDPSDHKTHPH